MIRVNNIHIELLFFREIYSFVLRRKGERACVSTGVGYGEGERES